MQEAGHQKQALEATQGAVAEQINPKSDRLLDNTIPVLFRERMGEHGRIICQN
jgi:hypothetical protein